MTFWFGKSYSPKESEFMLNHARTGIVMALRATMPQGSRVGVVAYNCHTVANAVVESGCIPVFIDVTEDLHMSLQHLATICLDAIIVTNLFGMHNDIAAIQSVQPDAIIIVDNAHGYGLPIEGDFTVYSINQGKLPALGAGGLLCVNKIQYQKLVEQQYSQLPKYTLIAEIKLFVIMLLNAWMHIPTIYGMITLPLKRKRKGWSCREKIAMKRMAKGVSRLYNMALPQTQTQIIQRTANAQYMLDVWQKYGLGSQVWYGENAFMLIGRHENPEKVVEIFAAHGVEVATHFARAIEWAKQFGYKEGSCPMAEKLTKELIMIPTYKEIAI